MTFFIFVNFLFTKYKVVFGWLEDEDTDMRSKGE